MISREIWRNHCKIGLHAGVKERSVPRWKSLYKRNASDRNLNPVDTGTRYVFPRNIDNMYQRVCQVLALKQTNQKKDLSQVAEIVVTENKQ